MVAVTLRDALHNIRYLVNFEQKIVETVRVFLIWPAKLHEAEHPHLTYRKCNQLADPLSLLLPNYQCFCLESIPVGISKHRRCVEH